jgi:hypothetical protein
MPLIVTHATSPPPIIFLDQSHCVHQYHGVVGDGEMLVERAEMGNEPRMRIRRKQRRGPKAIEIYRFGDNEKKGTDPMS